MNQHFIYFKGRIKLQFSMLMVATFPSLKCVCLQQVYAYIIQTLLEINYKQVKLSTFYRRKTLKCQHMSNYPGQIKQENNVIAKKNIELEDSNHSCSQ